MRKIVKRSVITLLIIMAMTLTACTNGELGLYNAIVKQQEAKIMDMTTKLDFNMSVEGISEEDKEAAQQVIDMINSYKISMDQRIISKEDNTKVDSFTKSNIDFGGMQVEMPIWQNIDMSNDELKMRQIIKMPQILMDSMGEEFKGKTYLDYDMSELMEEANQENSFKEIIKWSKDLQPKYENFLKQGLKEMNPNIKMVSSLGEKLVDGEKINAYKLKLNDENLKKLVKFIGNTIFENEEMAKILDEYMELVLNMSEVTELEREEINSEWKEIKSEKYKFQDKFNEFIQNIEDIKILSDEGIVIEYGVNKDGYIVYQKGEINLLIDLEDVGKKIVKENIAMRDDFKGKITFKINFHNKVSNINNKDLKIEGPNNTEENTIKIADMMKSFESNPLETEIK